MLPGGRELGVLAASPPPLRLPSLPSPPPPPHTFSTAARYLFPSDTVPPAVGLTPSPPSQNFPPPLFGGQAGLAPWRAFGAAGRPRAALHEVHRAHHSGLRASDGGGLGWGAFLVQDFSMPCHPLAWNLTGGSWPFKGARW